MSHYWLKSLLIFGHTWLEIDNPDFAAMIKVRLRRGIIWSCYGIHLSHLHLLCARSFPNSNLTHYSLRKSTTNFLILLQHIPFILSITSEWSVPKWWDCICDKGRHWHRSCFKVSHSSTHTLSSILIRSFSAVMSIIRWNQWSRRSFCLIQVCPSYSPDLDFATRPAAPAFQGLIDATEVDIIAFLIECFYIGTNYLSSLVLKYLLKLEKGLCIENFLGKC